MLTTLSLKQFMPISLNSHLTWQISLSCLLCSIADNDSLFPHFFLSKCVCVRRDNSRACVCPRGWQRGVYACLCHDHLLGHLPFRPRSLNYCSLQREEITLLWRKTKKQHTHRVPIDHLCLEAGIMSQRYTQHRQHERQCRHLDKLSVVSNQPAFGTK